MYDEECVFTTSVRRSPPTNAAINALLEENRRLRGAPSQAGAIEEPFQTPGVNATSQEAHMDGLAPPTIDMAIGPVDETATPAKSDDTPRSTSVTSTHHGPTSTLHDDTLPVSQS